MVIHREAASVLWKKVLYLLEHTKSTWVGGEREGEVFLGMWGPLFDVYSGLGGRHWFGLVEMTVAVTFASVSSIQPTSTAGCYALSLLQLMMQMVMLVVIVCWRPYGTLGNVLVAAFMYGGNVILCAMEVAMVTKPSDSYGKDQSNVILSRTLSAFALINLGVFFLQRMAFVYIVAMKLKLITSKLSIGKLLTLLITRRTKEVETPHQRDVLQEGVADANRKVDRGTRRRLEALEVLVRWAIDERRRR
jgi:hypothetical protein